MAYTVKRSDISEETTYWTDCPKRGDPVELHSEYDEITVCPGCNETIEIIDE